jgi:hypothetical protein
VCIHTSGNSANPINPIMSKTKKVPKKPKSPLNADAITDIAVKSTRERPWRFLSKKGAIIDDDGF